MATPPFTNPTKELMKKLKEADIRISDQYLPQRTRFCMNLQDLLYDEMYSIQV